MRRLTMTPPCMTPRQHARAEREGWAIFVVEVRRVRGTVTARYQVQKLDEVGKLGSDDDAFALAREMGIRIDEDGYVIGGG